MLDELRRDLRRELRRTLVSLRRREARRPTLLGNATVRLEMVEAGQNRDGGSGRVVIDGAPGASTGRLRWRLTANLPGIRKERSKGSIGALPLRV